MHQMFSNNSNESRKLNFVKTSVSLLQIAYPIPSDLLHQTYNAKKQRSQVEYLG